MNLVAEKMKKLMLAATPHGLIDYRRRQIALRRLGIDKPLKSRGGVAATASSVTDCSFALWPMELRQGPFDWALVDVGANNGDFSAAALSLVKPAEMILFEPQPSCQNTIRRAVGRRKNCKIIQAAIGSHCGKIMLNCTHDSKFASVLKPLKDAQQHYAAGSSEVEAQIEVPLVTLDSVLAEVKRIGLLKIDVQGFELQVLKGSVEVLRRTDAVLLEINYVPHYEDAVSFEELFAFLTEMGFALRGVGAPYGDRHGAPLWADAIFCRKS